MSINWSTGQQWSKPSVQLWDQNEKIQSVLTY